jgi:hypothetical protein
MQAILTKFLPPTNNHDGRVKASCAAGSHVHKWDHSQPPEENHTQAAAALVRKLGWVPEQGAAYAGLWARGGLANGDCVFVLASTDDRWREGFEA